MKERIKALCKEYGISMNKLEETLGFGKGYISKLGNSTPNAVKIKKIADYFNVSVDYLMTGDEKESENKYYINDETAEMAQKLFENKELIAILKKLQQKQEISIFYKVYLKIIMMSIIII